MHLCDKERVAPPNGGLVTLPTTPPPVVGGFVTEVSDLAVFLIVVEGQW